MDNESKNRFRELVEKFSDEQMCLIIVSLMSADTLINEEACHESLRLVNQIIDAIKTANITEERRSSWLNRAEASKSVISGDLEMFKKRGKNE